MKKIFYTVFCFTILTTILLNYNEITDSIRLSFNICINSLFPSLMPFMILSNIIINYNFVEIINDSLGKITNKLFRINKNTSFAIALSLFSGTPSNAKYLKDLYNNNLINDEDISKCINFCHFNNPIFVLSTIGLNFLNNKKLGLIILISQIIGALIIGISSFKKYTNTYKVLTKKEKKFMKILNESIIDTSNNLVLILGVITICLIISTLLNSILNINNNYKFVYGLLEMTQGLKYLSYSNFNLALKGVISAFLISFGGISIHIQVFSILDNKKIRYIPYLISRLVHGVISSIICLLLIYIYKI